jgi:hypothetical protein
MVILKATTESVKVRVYIEVVLSNETRLVECGMYHSNRI